jgi:ABC-type lipoprotein release transport system permease subunit
MAFANGLNLQRKQAALMTGMGYAQIHADSYRKDPELANWLNSTLERKVHSLIENTSWTKASTRVLANGMAASSKTASGISLLGVDYLQEANLNRVAEKIIDGQWLDGSEQNEVVLGKKLAEKLDLEIGSRMVITFQSADDELISLAYKLKGIFSTGNRALDEMQVFIARDRLASQLGLPQGSWHEMALIRSNSDQLNEDIEHIQTTLGDKIEVSPWTTLVPELAYADEMMASSLLIFMSIILMALAFGIINNMLMAVLERKRELGMLMAVGMNKWKVFRMVMLETVFVSLIGGPTGMGLGYITNSILKKTGLDLSFYSEGLQEFGIDSVIFPVLEAHWYVQLAIMVVLTALISGLFPAMRALRMNPIETMRTI